MSADCFIPFLNISTSPLSYDMVYLPQHSVSAEHHLVPIFVIFDGLIVFRVRVLVA